MREAQSARGLWALAVAAALVGCAVTPPAVIDDGLFACTDPAEDCGPGQGCAEGNVYSPDFCRPACDPDDPSSCPGGVCTARGACLAGCTILADGSDTGCAEEFTCVRIDALRDDGVCWPVDGCTRSDECDDETEQCINEALGLPAMTSSLSFDNLYCTARPDEEQRCPEGYLTFDAPSPTDLRGTVRVCYPPCAVDGSTLCPPATTCFGPFGDIFTGSPERPPCFPGFWGLPCEDDTHCLIGRCLPVGEGRRACTETCAGAEGLGGCQGLDGLGEGLFVFSRLTCEDVGGVETCVPRFDLGSLCDAQLDCVADAPCAAVTLGDIDTRACVRACDSSADCVAGTGGVEAEYRCVGGLCRRRRRDGSRCAVNDECLSGICCPVGEGIAVCRAFCSEPP